MLPNFLVIGAQKSGTTWINRFCKKSGIYVPKDVKELTFFNSRKRFEQLGLDGYSKYFDDWNGAGHAGEATPGYFWTSQAYKEWGPPPMFASETPKRVRNILGPDVKLILLLRNPIDRALSAHQHHVRNERFTTAHTLSDTCHHKGIVHIGFYYAHLTEWLKFFDMKNFWIRTYEDFFSDIAHLNELRALLGGQAGGERLFRRKVYGGLGFKRGEHGAVSSIGQLLAAPETILHLRDVFAEDVAKLGTLGIDTSAWMQDFGTRCFAKQRATAAVTARLGSGLS